MSNIFDSSCLKSNLEYKNSQMSKKRDLKWKKSYKLLNKGDSLESIQRLYIIQNSYKYLTIIKSIFALLNASLKMYSQVKKFKTWLWQRVYSRYLWSL